MAAKPIVPGVYQLSLGVVNAFLLASDDGVTVIDTGMPGHAEVILAAVREIGRHHNELRHILVTHCHEDHAGSLAELKERTGATVSMHPVDAAMVRAGKSLRPLHPAPGVINGLIFGMLIRRASDSIAAAQIDREVSDGDELPLAGGLSAVHVPGHCAGQLAFLWPQQGGVLFAADACANAFGLSLSPGYEDLDQGRRSLQKLAGLDFEVACFGHGRPIRTGAAERFRRKWASNSM